MAIIGKYKRPGVFTEEYDNSVISSPVADGLTTTMVVGFSKKGPVNNPVLLRTTGDLEKIFGTFDRNLERKGSFFQRTISKMLESGPVYAMNLLKTDDTLDTLEYQSLSCASNFNNDIEKTAPYRRFFNTTGFWKRDPESFINITKGSPGYNERILNITNMSDKNITVFIFKSKVTGFDRTIIEWYGTADKVPPYLNTKDYASDYMVDVLVVGGDYTNYQQLSVDPRWSQYFSNSGLRKTSVDQFAYDANVNLLGYYNGVSLIPYFRDGNGRNIFIESVVNQDTDKTGLFCAFNYDLFETDEPNGLVDLIGYNLVGEDKAEIDFLSYRDTIIEVIPFTNVILDQPGNVTNIHSTGYTASAPAGGPGGFDRTWVYGEGIVEGVKYDSLSSTTTDIIVNYTIDPAAYSVVGGVKIFVNQNTPVQFSLSVLDYPNITITDKFYSAFVLDTSGNINKIDSFQVNKRPTPAATDIVLGYIEFTVQSSQISNTQMNNVTVDTNGFIGLVKGPSADYDVVDLTQGKIQVVFNDTALSRDRSNYILERKYKMFSDLRDKLSSANFKEMAMLIDDSTGEKVSTANMVVSDFVVSNTQNKSFKLDTKLSPSDMTDILNGMIIFYNKDNEFIIGSEGMSTTNDIADANNGVVSTYSDFYDKFYTGVINTGDYFYDNYISATTSVQFERYENTGNNYILFTDAANVEPYNTGDQIIIPEAIFNKGTYTVLNQITSSNPQTEIPVGAGEIAYKVDEVVIDEDVLTVTKAYELDNRIYLKMYIDNNGLLFVQFMDKDLESDIPVDTTRNSTINVQSNKSNFKETVDVVYPTGYVRVPNKILVDGTRYSNIKIGDFLESNWAVDINNPEIVPRKLTRVLSKKLYSLDTSLVEITCDAEIKVNIIGDTPPQAMRYSTIETYVTTYKGMSLTGFRVRQDSMPDGSETRQNDILNIVQKGTPLFKSLTNKEAIDFRYLIDSFGNGLTERSKQQLVDICGARLDCFGFINMPSMKAFKDSTSPTFVDSEGTLQIEFVAKGGDPESNPAFLYSFGEGVGTTAVGYFTPYLTINDNGRPFNVPPAMFVASTYMRKFNSTVSTVVPWTIMAGTTNGRITGIAGVEMDFNPDDLDWLSQAQMNPIIFRRNRGFVIDTENTAQILYKSSLSYIHSREVLIELERELSRMLLDYQSKFNTPETRSEIKLKADQICERYMNRNALYNYFNKCDSENNTPDMIDNQIGQLDSYVEIVKGLQVIVNTITIMRTGTIASGGFQ